MTSNDLARRLNAVLPRLAPWHPVQVTGYHLPATAMATVDGADITVVEDVRSAVRLDSSWPRVEPYECVVSWQRPGGFPFQRIYASCDGVDLRDVVVAAMRHAVPKGGLTKARVRSLVNR